MNTAAPQASPRRRLILAGLGAGICAAVAGVLGWHRGKGTPTQVKAPLPSPTRPTPTADTFEPTKPVVTGELTREWFEPYLNTEFHVKVSALTAATVKLIELTPAKTIADKDKGINYTSFSLTFSGPKSLPEDSKVYRVEHGVLGAMDLFLSPIGKHEKEVRLEAVFTRRA